MFKKGDKVTLTQEEPSGGERAPYHSPAIIIKLTKEGYILAGFDKWENGNLPIVVTMHPERNTGGLEATGTLHATGRFITEENRD